MTEASISPASPASLLDRLDFPEGLGDLDTAELEQLAAEIREMIIDTVAENGGHLSPNLGVVELTIALHRVFESPRDVILWDTGHQAYAHKLLTGRREDFHTLRLENGLSGFPSRKESDHDWIENSHASTATSYAHGLTVALAGQARAVVVVVGDGALTGGLAYEGLNNLGFNGRDVVVVFNDNGRSYAPTITGLSVARSELTLSRAWREGASRRVAAGGSPPDASEPEKFFTALGFRYLGPIDGHDIGALEDALGGARESGGPVLVHAVTKKGRSYAFAEEDEEKRLHDVACFDRRCGPVPAQGAPTYTEVFTAALLEAASNDSRIHAITAAMPGPTGLLAFERAFPGRCHDVGIAEQHAVVAAAGMALGGLRPVVAIFSTFFCRALDQLNLDVALHELPVVFCIDRAGITGSDGPSHHGLLDLVLATRIPGLTVFAPSSGPELEAMLALALTLDTPSLIRYPKGAAAEGEGSGTGLEARRLRDGSDVCILAVGRLVAAAEDAADTLEADGVSATVWDVRVCAPLDPAMIADAADHAFVVTVEDGYAAGGVGSSIACALGAAASRPARRILQLGAPLEYLPHGDPSRILARLGLDGVGIARSVRAHVPARARTAIGRRG
jgi:1-deoxy-D-xylulose-5-phosphate synthase